MAAGTSEKVRLTQFSPGLALSLALWHNLTVMSRILRFFLMIVLGIALGLIYGWVISPVKYVDTTPDTLRLDYKADYVLMVAESFQATGDLNQAVRSLAVLGEKTPLTIVQEAIVAGQAAGYTPQDLEVMGRLLQQLQLSTPVPLRSTP